MELTLYILPVQEQQLSIAFGIIIPIIVTACSAYSQVQGFFFPLFSIHLSCHIELLIEQFSNSNSKVAF